MLWSHDGVDGTRVAARQEFSKSGRSENSSNKWGVGGGKSGLHAQRRGFSAQSLVVQV